MLLLFRLPYLSLSPTQVAQGVLDHTNSVLGSSQHQYRRTLKDLLSLYSITAAPPETNQGIVPASSVVLESLPDLCCWKLCRAVPCCAVLCCAVLWFVILFELRGRMP